MQAQTFTLLVLVLVQFLNVQAQCSGTEFDYYLLVQQWPAGFSSHETTYFTLHGMWPSRVGAEVTSYPCTCTTEELDEAQLDPVMSRMTQYWPSLKGSAGNTDFWSHEWSKHGTCAKMDSQLDYFKQTLDIHQLLNPFQRFADAGILPGGSYLGAQFDKAFADLGVSVLLGCDHSFSRLHELGFCFDKKFNLIECDDSVKALGHRDEVTSCDRQKPIFYASVQAAPPQQEDDHHSHESKDECIDAQQGPACANDGDCATFSGCVRCAHTGHCTRIPLEQSKSSSHSGSVMGFGQVFGVTAIGCLVSIVVLAVAMIVIAFRRRAVVVPNAVKQSDIYVRV